MIGFTNISVITLGYFLIRSVDKDNLFNYGETANYAEALEQAIDKAFKKEMETIKCKS
jgi:hypothetical protein